MSLPLPADAVLAKGDGEEAVDGEGVGGEPEEQGRQQGGAEDFLDPVASW